MVMFVIFLSSLLLTFFSVSFEIAYKFICKLHVTSCTLQPPLTNTRQCAPQPGSQSFLARSFTPRPTANLRFYIAHSSHVHPHQDVYMFTHANCLCTLKHSRCFVLNTWSPVHRRTNANCLYATVAPTRHWQPRTLPPFTLSHIQMYTQRVRTCGNVVHHGTRGQGPASFVACPLCQRSTACVSQTAEQSANASASVRREGAALEPRQLLKKTSHHPSQKKFCTRKTYIKPSCAINSTAPELTLRYVPVVELRVGQTSSQAPGCRGHHGLWVHVTRESRTPLFPGGYLISRFIFLSSPFCGWSECAEVCQPSCTETE